MDKKVIAHFQAVDATLFLLTHSIQLEKHVPRNPRQYFPSLCNEIIGQQLSGRVADVLFERFKALFPNKKISSRAAILLSEDSLRKTGMSWSKARFIKDLAQKIVDKKIKLNDLQYKLDDEVIAELTKVKGVGPWTAEMFLMFTLGREDVFSYGDLGLRRAIQKLYKFKKEPTIRQMEKIAARWKPYRTYAARILWKSLEIYSKVELKEVKKK